MDLYMFRNEFLVKEMIFDVRWVFNFFSCEKAYEKELQMQN